MKEEKCDVVDIWEVLGKRWSLHILKNLSTNGIIRFNELKRLIPDISRYRFISKITGARKGRFNIKKNLFRNSRSGRV